MIKGLRFYGERPVEERGDSIFKVHIRPLRRIRIAPNGQVAGIDVPGRLATVESPHLPEDNAEPFLGVKVGNQWFVPVHPGAADSYERSMGSGELLGG